MHRTMNVVPFRASETFQEHGIDWTKPAATERERPLREAFLTYESSCGPGGLTSLVLLALVSRRQGAVAEDLQYSADLAEVMLAMKLREHQREAVTLAASRTCEGASQFGDDRKVRIPLTRTRRNKVYKPFVSELARDSEA